MIRRLKFLKDRLRNKIVRLLGGMPRDDFNMFTDDLFKVLNSFENFVKATSNFSNIVATRLGIHYDGNTDTVTDIGKTNEEVEEEYRDRGMI